MCIWLLNIQLYPLIYFDHICRSFYSIKFNTRTTLIYVTDDGTGFFIQYSHNDGYSGAPEGLSFPALHMAPAVLFTQGNCQIPLHVLNKIKFTEQDYDSANSL